MEKMVQENEPLNAQEILKNYKNKTDLVYEIGIVAFDMSMLAKNLCDSLSLKQQAVFHKLEMKYLEYFDELMKDVINFTLDAVKKSTK